MLSTEGFQALVRADVREVAELSLRYKFGRLSNARILSVLRPAAEEFNGLRALSDRTLLTRGFSEGTSCQRRSSTSLLDAPVHRVFHDRREAGAGRRLRSR